MAYKYILYEERDSVGTLTLNRPVLINEMHWVARLRKRSSHASRMRGSGVKPK